MIKYIMIFKKKNQYNFETNNQNRQAGGNSPISLQGSFVDLELLQFKYLIKLDSVHFKHLKTVCKNYNIYL